MLSCLGTFGDQIGSFLSLPSPPAPKHNRLITKVRKTQHQNPEFGHTWGEIENKHAKMYISVNRLVTNHISDQGRPDPRGGLCCFWCPNKNWTLSIDASDALKIIKNEIELRKLQVWEYVFYLYNFIKSLITTEQHTKNLLSVPELAFVGFGGLFIWVLNPFYFGACNFLNSILFLWFLWTFLASLSIFVTHA